MSTAPLKLSTTSRAPSAFKESTDDKIFGAAFNGRVVRRFIGFMRPYRARLALAIASVVVFTASQLLIPLIISTAVDKALAPGGADKHLLVMTVVAFFAVICVNAVASKIQETIVGKTGERILFDLRRAM